MVFRGHIIAVCHEIFPDCKKNGNTENTDQGLGRLKMFYYHLSCCGEKENFHNCLGGMTAEHFYKLNTDYKGKCLGKKVCKKISVHIHDRSAGGCENQPETGQGDNNKNYNGQNNFCITRYVIDQFIEMFADLMVDCGSVIHVRLSFLWMVDKTG